jgi:hypothetical protein
MDRKGPQYSENLNGLIRNIGVSFSEKMMLGPRCEGQSLDEVFNNVQRKPWLLAK